MKESLFIENKTTPASLERRRATQTLVCIPSTPETSWTRVVARRGTCAAAALGDGPMSKKLRTSLRRLWLPEAPLWRSGREFLYESLTPDGRYPKLWDHPQLGFNLPTNSQQCSEEKRAQSSRHNPSVIFASPTLWLHQSDLSELRVDR